MEGGSLLSMATDKGASIRLDARILKRVDGMARAVNRPRSWVINKALTHYLEYEKWFVHEVRKGLKEAEAGDLIDHQTVVKTWERKRAAKVDSRR
jgi:predicted transcriptional regulator